MRKLILTVLALLLAACAGRSGRARDPGLRDTSPYEFHRALALTLMRTDQPSQAVAHIRALQKLRPTSAEPFRLMGRAYAELGVTTQARMMYERAVTLDPKDAGTHAALGVLLAGDGQAAAAERAHRRAIALAPTNPAYLNNLGFSLYVQGRDAEAIASYEQALVFDAGLRRVHLNLGFAYGHAGDLGRATTHFELAGTRGQLDNNLGLVFEARRDLEQAYQRYLSAVSIEPELDEARANLARVCAALGRPVPALPAPASNGGEP